MTNDDNPTFELEDIFDEISLDYWTQKIGENIKFILKREKLWQNHFSLCFPAGSYQDICEEHYQFDFEIFSDLNTIIASGLASALGFGWEILKIQTSQSPI